MNKNIKIIISLFIAVLIPFALMVWIRTHQSSGFAGKELIVYPLVFGSGGIIIIYLLKRFFIGERISGLNCGKSSFVIDIAWGLGLTAIYFILFYFFRYTLSDVLAFRSNEEMLGLMLDMRESPVLIILWFGPVLWIGIALYEELIRVFLLDGLFRFGKSAIWVFVAILVSASIMGFAHWSQGPYGIVTIGIKSIVSGYFYYKVRRVLPLVLAHVLYDGIQVAVLLLTYP